MIKRKLMKGLGAGILCMAIVSGINEGIKVYAAGSTEETQLSQEASKESNSGILETAGKLGGEYDAATKTLTLKSDITLKESVSVENSEALTIDMNGKKITGGGLSINNDTKAPVTFVGKGTIKESQISKYGQGKLTLNGDIVYKNTKDYVLLSKEGTTVIKKGTFYSKKTSILWTDFNWDSVNSYLYVKGGTFHGNISLSNNATYIQKGTIDGKVCIYGGKLYVKGGTLNKGVYLGGDDEASSNIYISGGKILDQIVLDNSYGGNLEISGGVIKSGKSAVIQSNVLPSEQNNYSNIKITGGRIISTKENGYGIKAINTEIVIKGGSIENTTKKGKAGVYSVRYNKNRKNVQVKNAKKVTIKGFKSDVKNQYKKNYCGNNVKYSINAKGTLTISGKGDMFADSTLFANIDNGKFKDKIKKVVVKEGVTGVGGFAGCNKIKSVTLPSSVKKIYVSAFSDCISLEKITMKDGVESIGVYAFFGAKALKEINMPDTVTEVGNQAFSYCTKLQKVH